MITGQIGRGGHYSDLKQAITIVITDFNFVPETKRCHTVFRLLEKEEHFPFNDLVEIHVLNLTRLSEDNEDGKLTDWLRFLKAESEEEFKMLAEKNPVIGEAYSKLEVMSQDEANRMLYEARLKAQRDEYARIQYALEEGERTGRLEGERTGRLEAARNALKMGLPVEQIALITGIPSENILKQLK
jgi:predicted transposase/invertase (TIGR01784 family)